MKLFCVVLICSTLANVSQSEFKAYYRLADYMGLHRDGLPKALKVLDWLVMEKDDPDRSKMTEERVDKFVNFVLENQNLCKTELDSRKISCEELRKAIDNHKFEAGTEGIDFDEKMKSVRRRMKGLFSSQDINHVQPYGVLLLLDWALEFSNHEHTRLLSKEFPKPTNLKALIKFIINNKDALWARIDEGMRRGVRPLVEYFLDNLDQMGWLTEKPTAPMLCRAFSKLRNVNLYNADNLLAKSGQSYYKDSQPEYMHSVSNGFTFKETDPCEQF